MAKISLRDYLNGIEELIDNRRTEDALAHCRHILTLFPKNLATYRLMGKAYLESHQHEEARDIFQRVLSSVPDDFVSHIGMSIIREEANDLDDSIWHMERAFEAQPSNRAVQDELRRLYGKREGYAPPKVRLTRGALARMYAHGDLYNQAIGELRNALAEDPQRPDLQVLLAEMYYKTQQITDAMEICSDLNGKLPYCLYANRLMVDILRGNGREIEADTYLKRVEELDPYAAHADTKTPIDSTSADIVMLEQLILDTPAARVQAVPKAWTDSLVLSEKEFKKEELPQWLSVENEAPEPSSAFETTAVEEISQIDETLSVEKPGEMESEVRIPEPGSILETAALEEIPPTYEPISQEEPKEITSEEAAVSEPVPPFEIAASEETPTDREPVSSDAQDWLSDLRPKTSTLVAEINELSSETESFVEETEQQPEAEQTPQDLSDDEVPAFPEEKMAAESEIVSDEEVEKEVSSEDELSLGWLENLAAQEGAPEEELLTTPEDREAAKPEWLREEKPEDKQNVLAWLDEIKAESETRGETDETPFEESMDTPSQEQKAETINPEINVTTPLWLKELNAEMGGTETLGGLEEISPRSMEEVPDWLNELRSIEDEPIEEETSEIEELPPMRTEVEPATSSEEVNKLDWLEELGPPKVVPSKGDWVSEAGAPEQPIKAEASAVAEAPKPARKAAGLKVEQDAPNRLELARQALNFGKLGEAADHYGYLLRRRLLIKDVIADLDAAVHRYPGDATLWQILGDAYMRNNQLRPALDAYTRAKDLL